MTTNPIRTVEAESLNQLFTALEDFARKAPTGNPEFHRRVVGMELEILDLLRKGEDQGSTIVGAVVALLGFIKQRELKMDFRKSLPKDKA
jgi:hypothetical protein